MLFVRSCSKSSCFLKSSTMVSFTDLQYFASVMSIDCSFIVLIPPQINTQQWASFHICVTSHLYSFSHFFHWTAYILLIFRGPLCIWSPCPLVISMYASAFLMVSFSGFYILMGTHLLIFIMCFCFLCKRSFSTQNHKNG